MAFESYGNRPTNFVGKDGFHWWVGQVEKTDENVKNSNRYKVRIVGHHLADCEGQGTDALPWANTVAPTTDSFTASGGVTTNLSYGDWVIGFFMDSEMAQQPYILGSIGAIRNARGEDAPVTPPFLAASQEGCRAFKNFAPGPVAGSPYVVIPSSEAEIKAAAAGQVASAGAPPGTATNPEKGFGQPPAVAYSQGPGSAMNEAAMKCTTISQASCPTGQTASKLELVLSELFKAISESGGQVGSYLTSKVTGYAREGEAFIMGYVNKIMAIVFQSYGWLKGKLYNLVQQGVQYLITTLLSLVSDKGKPKDAKPPYDPKKPEKILDKIQKFLEDTLAKIGCSIESLYDRILQFITDFLFGAVEDFWSEALCGIESLVNGLMSALENFLSNAINAIIQPLLSILEGIAAPLNDIFSSISEIMDFLGITCSGLPAECKKVIQDCGEGPKTKAKGLLDDLDAILAAIAADTQPSPAIAACDDAKNPVTPPLNVAITGGTPKPTTIPTPTTPTTGTPTATTTTPTLSILIDPASVTKNEGDSHTFTVVATTSDGSTINYQWQKFDISSGSFVNISGATSSSYSFSSVALSDEASYRVVCSSPTTTPSTLESADAFLSVLPVTVSAPNSFNLTSYLPLSFTSAINVTTNLNGGTTLGASYSNAPLVNPLTSSVTVGGTATAIFSAANFTPIGTSGVTYSLIASPQLVSPGGTVKLTLTTSNVPNGTKLDFYIFGVNLQLSDVVSGSLTSSFIVSNNTATKLISVSDPVSFSQTELVFAALKNGGAATQFAIQGNPITVTTPPTFATPTPPIACQPIVSSTGQIISIPICSQGTPYIAAPKIYVQGNGIGYGASAVADLDADGYVRNVRVLRPGRGYPPNPPVNLDCIISGFTILKPGFGYDVPPAVFVDGDLDVAEAVIANGVLIGINVKDKARTFTEFPTVKIIAVSQGVGAIAIPNISCLDKRDVREIAEVVGPTPVGEYIDCP